MSHAILSISKVFSPSPSSLALLLLASRSPRMESKLLTLASDRIESAYASDASKQKSLWIQHHIWESACAATPQLIHSSLLRLLQSPILTEQVTPPLLRLALLLLSKTVKVPSIPSLSVSILSTSLTAAMPFITPAALAAWLIGELYRTCEASRSTIIM